MAANYAASTITITNVVGSYFWRLNSFLIPKKYKYTTSKNSTSMLHVVTGN